MAAHLKLPAYGKRLLLARRAGDHPLEVALIFGHDWRADVGDVPILAINPEDYAPGAYDFHCVAGVRVAVHDQEMAAAVCDEVATPPSFGAFFDLLGELARIAAPVAVFWPPRSTWKAREASSLAFEARWPDREAQRMQWPRWWSDALEADYQRRWEQWMAYYAYTRGLVKDWRALAA